MRSRLSQHGNWDAETEMNAREVMAHRFSESSDAYDFALCARHRDGSIYGIADGKQCRVGRPVTRTDALKTLAKQGVPRGILGKIARIKDDKEFGKATRAISSGRKKQASTITPTKPSASSSIKPAAAKAGAPAQTKRKEVVTPDGRAEKKAKIAQLRAELKAKRDKQKETKKPQEETPPPKAKTPTTRKENMQAGAGAPKSRLEKILQDTYGIKGENLTPKELQKRVDVLKAFDDRFGPKETEKLAASLTSLVTANIGRKATKLSVDEVKALQDPKIQEKLLKGFQDPKSLIGGKNSVINFKDVDDLTLNASWAMLSPRMRNAFSNSGKPDGKAWQGNDKDGKPINGGNGNPERGKELFRLWLRQDGKCAYTGKPLTWDFADLEHIKPMGQVGRAAEQPSNWVWTLRSVNQLKADFDMKYLFDGNPSSSSKTAWGGVNSVKDYKKWQQEFDGAQTKAAGKDVWRSRAAAPTFISEYLGNRRGVVDSFNQAGHIKYVAMALGNAPVQGDSRKLGFPQEVKRDGERNATKNILNPTTNFVAGAVKGKMSPGLWIAENYPDLPPRAQIKIKELYNDTKNELKRNENSYGQTAAGFAKAFSERVNEYMMTEFPEL